MLKKASAGRTSVLHHGRDQLDAVDFQAAAKVQDLRQLGPHLVRREGDQEFRTQKTRQEEIGRMRFRSSD